jgi:hypothetical protein
MTWTIHRIGNLLSVRLMGWDQGTSERLIDSVRRALDRARAVEDVVVVVPPDVPAEEECVLLAMGRSIANDGLGFALQTGGERVSLP